MIYQNLNNAIIEALKNNNWVSKEIPFSVQKVQKRKFGELFTNVVLIISNKFKLDLKEVANKIVNSIDKDKYNFKKINIVNGYLNFFHKTEFLNSIIPQILKESNNFGRSKIGNGIKINYEWVSANPTGYLHIGHARNVIVGNCIVKIFEFTGFDVEREFYINDVGVQVWKSAKSVYYHYVKLINEKFEDFDGMYKNNEVKDAADYLFNKYGDYFKELKWIENKITLKENDFSTKVKKFFLNEIKKDCELFDFKFDRWFSESSLYENDKFEKFQQKFINKKISYKKDGALWLNAKKFGSPDDFVLVKSDGNSTYFSGDIMYHEDKYKRGYDLMFNLWGSDHHGHFKRIEAGLKAIGWDTKKFDVNFLQMVKIIDTKGKTFKLSKRAGKTIYLRDIVKEYGKNFICFMLISRQRSTDFVLDLSLLKEKSIKNPLYYIQYAYARAFQLVKKLDKNIKLNNYSELVSDSEKDLILSLYQLQSIVETCSKKQEPQLLTEYSIQLSKKFHAFYQKERIIGVDFKLAQQRIELVKAFLQVMKITFNLMGINPIKKM